MKFGFKNVRKSHLRMVRLWSRKQHFRYKHRNLGSNNHHHHHDVPLARIFQTLSRHFSLLFIASGRSSGLHSVYSHSYCMYVRAGRPAFARLYEGVLWSTSLMSSSLLLQLCPVCLVHLTWIVSWWEVGGCIVGALSGIASRTCSILLAAFLCNCRLAFSPVVLLASK